MEIADIHSDIIYHIVKERAEGKKQVLDNYHYPILKEAGVSCLIMPLWVEREYQQKRAFQRFIQLLCGFQAEIMDSNHFTLIRGREDLEHRTDDKIAVILGLEGMGFLEQWPYTSEDDEEQIHQIFSFFHPFHIKHAILAWYEINKIASGTGAKARAPLGLSNFGKKVVKRLQTDGYIIDLSHIDDTSFWDVMNEVSVPVICSHSNARKLCNHPRNLTEDQLKAIAACGGLVGINAYWEFIDSEYPSIHRLVDHIDYMVNLMGVEHVAFGFDFTNYIDIYTQDPKLRATVGLESAACIPDLIYLLQERGYSQKEIEAMSCGNFLQYLKKLWI
ncbi:dipeptidase [Geosporobacter ferrireducens]|uniref:Peptidase M19 n=1 Tax=Geosporobacter ferrireducens TaxID=1424294 RepID=A0A1D8GM00_9FIRM|nr:membrane dipeptidase [Geosporobacter ferrireducens]AOT71944.1 hypothetical protein Gferi_21825 [Geosporobacter ferrireducens]MTI55733.1 hypothetical protein [Geosporobacter ferrireducens]